MPGEEAPNTTERTESLDDRSFRANMKLMESTVGFPLENGEYSFKLSNPSKELGIPTTGLSNEELPGALMMNGVARKLGEQARADVRIRVNNLTPLQEVKCLQEMVDGKREDLGHVLNRFDNDTDKAIGHYKNAYREKKGKNAPRVREVRVEISITSPDSGLEIGANWGCRVYSGQGTGAPVLSNLSVLNNEGGDYPSNIGSGLIEGKLVRSANLLAEQAAITGIGEFVNSMQVKTPAQ